MTKNRLSSFKRAFTLAEVLITLGIIGIVAALVLGILKNENSKETYVKLKKIYSTLQNAINKTAAEYDCVEDMRCTGLFNQGNDADAAVFALNGIATSLQVSKNCGKSTGCFPNITYKTVGGGSQNSGNLNSDTSLYAKIILSDGTLLAWHQYDGNNCARDVGNGPMDKNCGVFQVDINGFNGPNTLGRDSFIFWLSQNGIVYPGGNSYLTIYNLPTYCNPNNNANGDNGAACTVEVLDNGGVNY